MAGAVPNLSTSVRMVFWGKSDLEGLCWRFGHGSWYPCLSFLHGGYLSICNCKLCFSVFCRLMDPTDNLTIGLPAQTSESLCHKTCTRKNAGYMIATGQDTTEVEELLCVSSSRYFFSNCSKTELRACMSCRPTG